MSVGETGGRDLTVETLAFIEQHWGATASEIPRAAEWDTPLLRNGVEKTIYYPDSEDIAGYTYALRNHDVVTVEEAGRTEDPIGTEFDFDIEVEVDVRVEAVTSAGASVIDGSSDWRAFLSTVKRAILREREYPLQGADTEYTWKWLTTGNESTLPDTEDNRNHYGTEFTVSWFGYEELP